MKAPFPYAGNKYKIADIVWQYLGHDVENYVEPFAGSLAVLLARNTKKLNIETVNDFSGNVANFWRAVSYDPEQVAFYADNPVNEIDHHARHLWLTNNKDKLANKLRANPDYYCAKSAGWWVWGVCLHIGNDYCNTNGPWIEKDGNFVKRENKNIKGINKKIPLLTSQVGINRQTNLSRYDYILGLFKQLKQRLREVRVICGEFERVLTSTVTYKIGQTGVFLDPPYLQDCEDPYSSDPDVQDRCLQWALENGNNPLLRIVLSSYYEEKLEKQFTAKGWALHRWKAHGGYSCKNNNNKRETLFISPYCIKKQDLLL
jgi:DNA adenine methylase